MTSRRVVYALGVVALVVVVGVGALAALPAPGFEPAAANSAIHARLAAAGFDDAVVDVTDERVLVRYTVPANVSRRRAALIALRAAADVAPGADRIVLQVYEAGEPVEQVTVETWWVHEYDDGALTVDELEGHYAVVPAGG